MLDLQVMGMQKGMYKVFYLVFFMSEMQVKINIDYIY